MNLLCLWIQCILRKPRKCLQGGLGLVMIPLVLLARFASVALPYIGFKRFRSYDAHAIKILTWGGLRGGISIALALSLTQDMHRELFLVITYIIVIFSILVQGLTVGSVIKKLGVRDSKPEEV